MVILALICILGVVRLMYYSIPYDEWIEREKEKAEGKKKRKGAKGLLDKLDAFLAELESRNIQISGDTAFLCKDGAVLFVQNGRGGVDISVVSNLVKVDYSLGITDEDIERWRATEELFSEMGGTDNGSD